MNKKDKHKKIKTKKYRNNIWNKREFRNYTYGEKNKIAAALKYIWRNLKYSRQRITRGFCDKDIWEMYYFLQKLIPNMLENLKENRVGSPAFLKEDEDFESINDKDCHKEWDDILNQMIYLWRESDEETCTKKNPYEQQYSEAFEEFEEKYGLLGERLQTKEELEDGKNKHMRTMHFMSEVPEYEDIDRKYHLSERELDQYREKCKDAAIEMLKEYFYDLWD